MNGIAANAAAEFKIDARRIADRLDAIYECGGRDDGTHARIAYSPEDRRGREVFSEFSRRLGLSLREDPAGNLIARREGRVREPAILIGSHLDTVEDGGKYDGAYGCVAALEVAEALAAADFVTEHPIEIIVFADEEGVRFGNGMYGSSAFSGGEMSAFHDDDLDAEGVGRREVLSAFGVDVSRSGEAVRSRAGVHAFIEPHVEQGNNLNRAGHSVGVVSSIAGVLREEITIRGEANHAGATMMKDRCDALATAAVCIAKLPDLVAAHGEKYSVATVGRIDVVPNAVNVIPGLCRFTLEVRDGDEAVMERIERAFWAELARAVSASGATAERRELARHAPARMNAWVRAKIGLACAACGYDYSTLPSGAFHDALQMAKRFPTGMIFVPSVGGVSHSRMEQTRPEDLKAGAEVLLRTILELDACEGETDESI
ncbi:MAG: Zn-dependent hydrolase [Clostridiales Family XIII bacterium]|nr:Zn-dependent hydrolase [Clostridiales Family XIII bacterium]